MSAAMAAESSRADSAATTSSTTNDSAMIPGGKTVAGEFGEDCLHIVDSRTPKTYKFPIFDHFVRGVDLSAITCPEPRQGSGSRSGPERTLAVLDAGFQHTACKESSRTLMLVLQLSFVRKKWKRLTILPIAMAGKAN